jgi:peptidoglycan/xylan/chitin deacetylase (PgdA/CDA1 family)
VTVAAPAVVLTFDNLGEASELEQGRWPPGRPTGEHPSVVEALPRVLGLLDELGLRATFFVEAVNTRAYPEAVCSIAAHGHEIGCHAWRHERWDGLDPAAERDVLERSLAAFAALGIEVRGFRPPGGGISAATEALLRSAGVRWYSAEGAGAGVDADGLVQLPFRWPLVDATYLHVPFSERRAELGLPAEPLPPDAFLDRIRHELGTEPDPVAATLVLHPFLIPGAGDAHERLLRELAAGPAEVLPGAELAQRLRRAA